MSVLIDSALERGKLQSIVPSKYQSALYFDQAVFVIAPA
jgi:hypothetical protein